MANSKCPACGCERFYVKDPGDEYECYEFKFREGRVFYEQGVSADEAPELVDDMEVFCNACAWHDKFRNYFIL